MSGSGRKDGRHQEELEWIQFRKDTLGLTDAEMEPQASKYMRKIKENPLVPIGALATVWALGYGLVSMRRGQAQLSQKMMRLRVAAQGFTVLAILGGILIGSYKPNKDNKNSG